jgi:hypothetical protein
MTIVRQTAAPLLLVLACAACGAGKDPLADSSVASASSAPATSNPPSPDRGPTATRLRFPRPAPPSARRPHCRAAAGSCFPAIGWWAMPVSLEHRRLAGSAPGRCTSGSPRSNAEPSRTPQDEILPVVEVIATIVQGSPGRDGKYRVRLTDAQIAIYHKAARKHRAVMLLTCSRAGQSSLPRPRLSKSGSKNPMSASP